MPEGIILESSRRETSRGVRTAVGSESGGTLPRIHLNLSRAKSHSVMTYTERFLLLRPWRKLLAVVLLTVGMVLPFEGRAGSAEAAVQEHSKQRRTVEVAENVGRTSVAVRAESQVPAAPKAPTYLRDVLPIFMGKCSRCHNDQAKFLKNWFDYKTALANRWEIKRRVWDSWKGSYFKQSMPIGNSPESEAITEEEHTIIRDWVDAGAPYGVPPTGNPPQSKAQKIEHGKRLFTTVCAVCHQPSGQGIPNRFPSLVGSDFLNSDKGRAIRIVLNGIQGEIFVNGQKFDNTMPSLPMADGDIACALTYVYNSFGNSGKEVAPEEVGALRGQKAVVNTAEEKSPFE